MEADPKRRLGIHGAVRRAGGGCESCRRLPRLVPACPLERAKEGNPAAPRVHARNVPPLREIADRRRRVGDVLDHHNEKIDPSTGDGRLQLILWWSLAWLDLFPLRPIVQRNFSTEVIPPLRLTT